MLLFGSIWYIHLTLGEELLLKEYELFFFSPAGCVWDFKRAVNANMILPKMHS